MREGGTVVRGDSWTAWPVYWTPVIVGALASVVAVVLFGVVGTAVGSWKAGNEGRITDFSAANEWWFEIRDLEAEEWPLYQERYQPLHNRLCSRLRRVT